MEKQKITPEQVLENMRWYRPSRKYLKQELLNFNPDIKFSSYTRSEFHVRIWGLCVLGSLGITLAVYSLYSAATNDIGLAIIFFVANIFLLRGFIAFAVQSEMLDYRDGRDDIDYFM